MTHHTPDEPLFGIDGNMTRAQAVDVVSATVHAILADTLAASRQWHDTHDPEVLGEAIAVAMSTLPALGYVLRAIVDHDDQEAAIASAVESITAYAD